MFTGIVEEVGRVSSIRKGTHSCVITIQAAKVLEDTHLGDSIATNGVCLTVTDLSEGSFSADVMHETLNRSSLGQLRVGSSVNLERAMCLKDRFGGHIVSGHIDGVGKIVSVKQDDNAVWYSISAPAQILRLIVEKGSIAIDGISLTVASVGQGRFEVSVIPHTRAQTNLTAKKPGDLVNLENDCIGKYVEHLLGEAGFVSLKENIKERNSYSSSASSEGKGPGGITKEFLLQQGF